MAKINLHIEIVSSTKKGLSSMSARSRNAVLATLKKYYTDVRVTIINDIADLDALVSRQPGLVFLGMSFVTRDMGLSREIPEKIWLSGYLDQHGIAYTGSGQLAHDLERNKHLAKEQVLEAGLHTSPYVVVRQNSLQDTYNIPLAYPLFVKPTNRGGGAGINSKSVVHNIDELDAKVQSIATETLADSLVEQYLPGREFSVAILKEEDTQTYMAMPIELIAAPNEYGARLLGQETKVSNTERAIEVTDVTLKAKVNQLALDVFAALGARDYGRIDIRLDDAGAPCFLEANLIPSLIDGYGSFPKACLLNANLGYEAMILQIVALGLSRKLFPATVNKQPILLPSSRQIVPSF